MTTNSPRSGSFLRRTLPREVSLWGGVVAIFFTLLLAIDHTAPTGFDRRLAGAVQSIPWGELAFIPRLGSDVGGGVYGFYMAPALVGVYLAVTRRWRALALVAAVFVLHFVMISPKQFITAYRPSPLFGVQGAGGLESFPSGHVQWAASFYGVLAYLSWQAAPARWRPAIAGGYALIVFGAMLGRIELGRHWPLDTVAGLLAGLIALRLLVAGYRFRWQPAPLAGN